MSRFGSYKNIEHLKSMFQIKWQTHWNLHPSFSVQLIKVFNIGAVQLQCHWGVPAGVNCDLFCLQLTEMQRRRRAACDVKVHLEKITCVSPSSGSLQLVGSQGAESWALIAAATLFCSTITLPGDRREDEQCCYKLALGANPKYLLWKSHYDSFLRASNFKYFIFISKKYS